jgi:hypothetical protein
MFCTHSLSCIVLGTEVVNGEVNKVPSNTVTNVLMLVNGMENEP